MIPRVLGDAVRLTPLVVLVAVTACGLLFGGFAVILDPARGGHRDADRRDRARQGPGRGGGTGRDLLRQGSRDGLADVLRREGGAEFRPAPEPLTGQLTASARGWACAAGGIGR